MYQAIILGGGLAGLSCALKLTRENKKVAVIEKEEFVGGLARTIESSGFKFDLGGHRIFTKKQHIIEFIQGLLGNELIEVERRSKIFLDGRYISYPLTPEAVFSLGLTKSLRITLEYMKEKVKSVISKKELKSLEDWIVEKFGRALFDIYFKEYSEKVWGLKCCEISSEWAENRIRGLSFLRAIRSALISDREVATLTRKFLYPRSGIGSLARAMSEEIQRKNQVFTGLEVKKIICQGRRISHVEAKNHRFAWNFYAENFVSTIPINTLIMKMYPSPPGYVKKAARNLSFRSLIVVALFINRERVTRDSWIYFPERGVPFGRLHEPKNWSSEMAPPGKTCLVVEYFCSTGDEWWKMSKKRLVSYTAQQLSKLGYIKREELLGGEVVKIENAYPLFTLDFRENLNTVLEYLGKFDNLFIAGRSGKFEYYNMDHAIESGIEAAEAVLSRAPEKNKIPVIEHLGR